MQIAKKEPLNLRKFDRRITFGQIFQFIENNLITTTLNEDRYRVHNFDKKRRISKRTER